LYLAYIVASFLVFIITAPLEAWYGGEAVVVKPGFKGAHVHVPLKQPVPWEDYQVIWKALLRLLPPEKQVLCDCNML